jgi:uncharacterized oxidoreductase
MRMTGNTILITGATSGIGRGLAEAFLARGNRVILTGRRRALLDEIASGQPNAYGFELDVADPVAVDEFAARVVERFPELNVLLNNAGVTRTEDLSADDWDVSHAEALIATNITPVLRLTGALLPTLKRQRQATIMTTTSGLGFVPNAQYATYSATKAFLHSWLQSLRHQLRATSVEVLELAPPMVQTALGGDWQLGAPQAMPLESYVAEVVSLLEAGDTADGEVLVERVRPIRFAERSGSYSKLYAAFNPSHEVVP